MLTTATTTPLPSRSPAPAAARPVFSTEDFELLRTAVAHYIRTAETADNTIKLGNLYHRLGRLG